MALYVIQDCQKLTELDMNQVQKNKYEYLNVYLYRVFSFHKNIYKF